MSYRSFLLSLMILLTLAGYSQFDKRTYFEEIKKERSDKNKEFINPEETPLPADNIKDFKGLNYYKPDLKFRIEARLEKYTTPDTIKMKTTTERLPLYIVYGRAIFSVSNITDTLTIFRNVGLMSKEGYEDYLFVPFTDETSGEGSYGGGRYIDTRIPVNDIIILDFNKAYNPYCVYNKKKYSCPIPPSENYINTKIRAGEKDYH